MPREKHDGMNGERLGKCTETNPRHCRLPDLNAIYLIKRKSVNQHFRLKAARGPPWRRVSLDLGCNHDQHLTRLHQVGRESKAHSKALPAEYHYRPVWLSEYIPTWKEQNYMQILNGSALKIGRARLCDVLLLYFNCPKIW